MIAMKIRSWWNGDAVKAKLLAEKKAGLRALAEFVAEKARVFCPVDTGELRGSIHVIEEAGGMRFHVIASAPHAEPVEWGYHHYQSGRFINPNPFLRPALRAGGRAMPQFLGGAQFTKGYHRGALVGATFE